MTEVSPKGLTTAERVKRKSVIGSIGENVTNEVNVVLTIDAKDVVNLGHGIHICRNKNNNSTNVSKSSLQESSGNSSNANNGSGNGANK